MCSTIPFHRACMYIYIWIMLLFDTGEIQRRAVLHSCLQQDQTPQLWISLCYVDGYHFPAPPATFGQCRCFFLDADLPGSLRAWQNEGCSTCGGKFPHVTHHLSRKVCRETVQSNGYLSNVFAFGFVGSILFLQLVLVKLVRF